MTSQALATEIPPYTFANELGIIRVPGVFSYVDKLKDSNKSTIGNKVYTIPLNLPDTMDGRNRAQTYSLLDNTETFRKIPTNAKILEFTVSKTSSAPLDSDLSFVLGYLASPDLVSTEAKQSLATFITRSLANPHADTRQVTGTLLNLYGSITFDQRLYRNKLEGLNSILDLEGVATRIVPVQADITCIDAASHVAWPISVIPCITIMNGTLSKSQLTFSISYTLPCAYN